ncbi:tyrosine recombinase XerC [Glaciimonas immobilis]|uniref:Tyrosine recombinase XerC n=1 Tax=Glaciimonas immobilis TaxID=728004 RepID=A0A840RWY1_9BURK|nr:tyrosine recombinase XerC [Glaciimonas immobilis]KAF3997304.1 tyrosine recombinase XerC [Glaciimonas immobilis]MBB5202395.1 integrase/recombinase XerC [Glaciimonas immobilis]
MPINNDQATDHIAPSTDIDAYLNSLRYLRRLSALTVSNYARDLAELAVFCRALSNQNDASRGFASVTHANIRKFAAQLHSRGLGPRSIARKLSAWRGFFDWLGEKVVVSSNPVDGLKAPKRGKPLPKALGADDAIRLVASPNPLQEDGTTMAACNHAMFELLYSSGLRVSELAGIDVRYTKKDGYVSAGWIDFDAGEVTVTGKGDRRRSVPVGQPALNAIVEWLSLRNTLVKADEPTQASQGNAFALFLTERGTRVSPRVVQLRLKAHARALDIPTDVHPHVLRHSFASHVLQGSGDLRAVQEMLGHTSISSTQVYTSLDFQRLAQVYDAAHPRAKKLPNK